MAVRSGGSGERPSAQQIAWNATGSAWSEATIPRIGEATLTKAGWDGSSSPGTNENRPTPRQRSGGILGCLLRSVPGCLSRRVRLRARPQGEPTGPRGADESSLRVIARQPFGGSFPPRVLLGRSSPLRSGVWCVAVVSRTHLGGSRRRRLAGYGRADLALPLAQVADEGRRPAPPGANGDPRPNSASRPPRMQGGPLWGLGRSPRATHFRNGSTRPTETTPGCVDKEPARRAAFRPFGNRGGRALAQVSRRT